MYKTKTWTRRVRYHVSQTRRRAPGESSPTASPSPPLVHHNFESQASQAHPRNSRCAHETNRFHQTVTPILFYFPTQAIIIEPRVQLHSPLHLHRQLPQPPAPLLSRLPVQGPPGLHLEMTVLVAQLSCCRLADESCLRALEPGVYCHAKLAKQGKAKRMTLVRCRRILTFSTPVPTFPPPE